MCVEAYNHPEFADQVNTADLVLPDGMPLVKTLKWLKGVQQERIAGMDMLPTLLKEVEKTKIGVYFYGSTDQVLQQTAEYLKLNYPKLKNLNFFSPPFRPLTAKEEDDIIQKINTSGAGLVIVCLGCPKQEQWMAKMQGKIQACMLGMGGALPVMIGLQKRAPEWMQKAGLEWMYRWLQEPKRLFKRYMYTNSMFLLLLVKELFRSKQIKNTLD